METHLQDLETTGFTVVPNVLSGEEVAEALRLFRQWINDNPQVAEFHERSSPHGIIKHFQVGQQAHAWFVRTRPAVKKVFAAIWQTEDLIVSFDGSCWLPANWKRVNCQPWTHWDQATSKRGRRCIQAFVALTSNDTRTFMAYEKSHLLHDTLEMDNPKNDFVKIPPHMLDPNCRRVVSVEAGSMVLWDSRTFHQNVLGDAPAEERIVQYVCMMPRHFASSAHLKKRKKNVETLRTTNHWPFPSNVNDLQPRIYPNQMPFKIDYARLVPPLIQT